VADNLRRETEPFVVGSSGVCFHARAMSQDVFSGQANSQVDNTLCCQLNEGSGQIATGQWLRWHLIQKEGKRSISSIEKFRPFFVVNSVLMDTWTLSRHKKEGQWEPKGSSSIIQ
jgi:hypothetical protein